MEVEISADMKLIVDGKEVDGTTITMVDSFKPYILPSTGAESCRHLMALLYIIALGCAISLVCRKKKLYNEKQMLYIKSRKELILWHR